MTKREKRDAAIALVLLWLLMSRKKRATQPLTQSDVSPAPATASSSATPADSPDDDGGGGVVIDMVQKAGVTWVWPVPTMQFGSMDPIAAVVTSGYGEPRLHPTVHTHKGDDIMYARAGSGTSQQPGDHGTKAFYAPVGTPVLAAADGTVWSTGKSTRGLNVVLDHGKPYATFYQHLDNVTVKKGDVVRAGDKLGTMGFDPTDAAQIRHLHFEVWKGGAGENAIDPSTLDMNSWGRKTWNVSRVA